MTLEDRITSFLAGDRFAVVGASLDRAKFGNKVLRAYLEHDLEAVPINPNADEIEGLRVYPDLKSVPGSVDGISIVTPPEVTELVVQEAVELGIRSLWIQPGAESERSVTRAEDAGANLIAGGPCILVTLRNQAGEP